MAKFQLKAPYSPQGDQVDAIKEIVTGFDLHKQQTLLGVTGSGKTFTMANVIQKLGKKTLILAHNKTLAGQLYAEFKDFFPENSVEFFVSYYDYYQPEAYIASSDTYIEKDASVNDEIDKLRHSATRNLLERDDVIVISSVSCIYGIGSPQEYQDHRLVTFQGENRDRRAFLKALMNMQYKPAHSDFTRGQFREVADYVDVFPVDEEKYFLRFEFYDDEVEGIYLLDALNSHVVKELKKATIFPTSHYVVSESKLKKALKSIAVELREQLQALNHLEKYNERDRLERRTLLDLEMLEELGYCSGVENYSRHLTGAQAGEPPPTLINFFGEDFLLIVDESHMTLPQVRGMYHGDRSRKSSLVEHGFRLPSALDNRPLNFSEFEKCQDKVLYVSATPGDYELEKTAGEFISQIIRPTGLLDPIVEVRDAKDQVQNFLEASQKVIARGERVLVTTLTKKLAEELTEYYQKHGVKVNYLHSDIDTVERMTIINQLREGVFDMIVGINLLREGLDLPEVSLVGILDADKEGFLRSERALIQTIGRAARNSEGRVLLYGYKITPSMERAISETKRRRKIQEDYNQEHGISPQTVIKKVKGGILETLKRTKKNRSARQQQNWQELSEKDLDLLLKELRLEMKAVAKQLDFEKAAKLRDDIKEIQALKKMQ